VAAVLADMAAEALESVVDGVVTTVVVDVDGVVDVVAAGGVTVVVLSSFLLHAANERAVARVTISSAVFMFLLDFKFGQSPVIVEPSLSKSPIVCKTRKAPAFPVPNP
jgi:cyanophycinase-like exopeptidase